MTQDQPISQQDVADLEAMYAEGEDITQRSLFEVWRELLSNVDKVAGEPIPMVVAHKVVNSWPKLTYQDTARYHAVYHEFLNTLKAPLEAVIAAHPEVLDRSGTEDGELNHEHYLNLLVTWHLGFEKLEQEWRAGDGDSHIQLAAQIDARSFVFSATGFAGHLDAIQFQVSDEEFMAAVEAAKEGQ